MSKKESLELWQVTDAHAGVYTLTVNTGSKTLHKEFSVTVLTVTTRLRTGEFINSFAPISLFVSVNFSISSGLD